MLTIDLNSLDEFANDDNNLIKLGSEYCKEIFVFFPLSLIDVLTTGDNKEKFFYCSFCLYFPQLEIYLFNYKVVNVIKNKITVLQVKHKISINRNEIADSLINFLEMWPEHDRVLLSPMKLLEIKKEKNGNINKNSITFGQWSILYSEMEIECVEMLVLDGQIR